MFTQEYLREFARALAPFLMQEMIPVLKSEGITHEPEEKVYTKQEAKELYLTDARFKKISNGFLRDAEARGDLINIGTEYRRKYKESNLLSAMAKKGSKKRE